MRCVELFTGCGGLAMGLSRSGAKPLRMSEWDKHSVANVLHNKKRKLTHVAKWPINQEDVRLVNWADYSGVDLVAGGPPCQPFSVGGRHAGHRDERDMWPEAVRAVRETGPDGFLFENVRGLTRHAFAEYLEWVVLSLSMPNIQQGGDDDWIDHLVKLRQAPRVARQYEVRVQKVNAADYGAAQQRHRVLITGISADLDASPPSIVPTHSRERLLWDQWVSGAYWKRHGIKAIGQPSSTDAALVRRMKDDLVEPPLLAWRTVRDAIADLGEPGARKDLSNHVAQPGARSYPGHTGSPIDLPAKALKAGVHGVPGGENMVAMPNGSVRYFTVREAARLQGMPDDYEFVGSWSENMRQCGNAVPVQLAEVAAKAVIGTLKRAKSAPKQSKAA